VKPIYADAHVHIHDCFDLERLLAAALDRAAGFNGPLLLLFSESDGDDYFEHFRRLAESGPEALAEPDSDDAGREPREIQPSLFPSLNTRVRKTAEPHSLFVDRNDDSGVGVYLVAGRQKVSSERIEVLALCLDPGDPIRREQDRTLSAELLVSRTLDAGAVAVVPWGFGKWFGSRGAKVVELARSEDFRRHPRFFMGDIPHRCWPWPTPRVFRNGIRVLPGTDPLPLPGAEEGVARYGFCVHGEWDPQRPVGSLLGALAGDREIERVGGCDSLWTTLAQQVRYRMK